MMATTLFNENQILLRVSWNKNCLLRDLLKNSRELRRINWEAKNGNGQAKNKLNTILKDVFNIRQEKYLGNIKKSLSDFNDFPKKQEDFKNRDEVVFSQYLLMDEGANQRLVRKINGLRRKHGRVLEFQLLQ